jgi:hypothetical protein
MPGCVATMTTSDAVSPGADGRLPAMETSFREDEVDLGLLPEDCREVGTQDFLDAVQALYYEPYAGQDGSFSFSYSEGLIKVSWIPLGDPGTEMLTIRWHLEDGEIAEAVALLEELLEREPNHQEARTSLAMVRLGYRLRSDC